MCANIVCNSLTTKLNLCYHYKSEKMQMKAHKYRMMLAFTCSGV